MPTRSEQDFLLAQLKVVAEAIARALGARPAGSAHIEDVDRDLADAWQALAGPLAPAVRQADATTLAAVLGDPRRVQAAAELVATRATLIADESMQRTERARAFALLEQAFARDQQVPGGDALLRSLSNAAPSLVPPSLTRRVAQLPG